MTYFSCLVPLLELAKMASKYDGVDTSIDIVSMDRTLAISELSKRAVSVKCMCVAD